MTTILTLSKLRDMVATDVAALRCRRTLQPAGGAGDKILPPTFRGATYAVESRRLPGRDEPVQCVLLDTVQSQANRMEEALLTARRGGKIPLALIEVCFPDEELVDPIGAISSLEAPHRLADAILRDSEHEGQPFRKSTVGRRLNGMHTTNATAVYELCPTALLFGMWDSTGPKGGLGAKFERALVSEVVGIGVAQAEKNRGVRNDPLGIRSAIRLTGDTDTWEIADNPKAKGSIAPSEVNHSNVPFEGDNAGVTVESVEQISVLSLIGLRRLRFPGDGGRTTERDIAARTALAALGLCAATRAFHAGMDLRSRCVLWPEEAMEWEALARPGHEPTRFALDVEATDALLAEAVHAATEQGLTWAEEAIALTPSKKLVKLVRASQEHAVKEKAESD